VEGTEGEVAVVTVLAVREGSRPEPVFRVGGVDVRKPVEFLDGDPEGRRRVDTASQLEIGAVQ